MSSRRFRLAPVQRGFSLLELLVVIVIMGILVGMTTLAVGVLGSDREIEDEARRFADVLADARDMAELEGRDYGFWLQPAGYEILRYDGLQQKWTSTLGDRSLEAHHLPEGVGLALELEGRRVLLRAIEKPEERVPQLILFAGGEVTPYQLTLQRAGGASVRIAGAVDGTMEIREDTTDEKR